MGLKNFATQNAVCNGLAWPSLVTYGTHSLGDHKALSRDFYFKPSPQGSCAHWNVRGAGASKTMS